MANEIQGAQSILISDLTDEVRDVARGIDDGNGSIGPEDRARIQNQIDNLDYRNYWDNNRYEILDQLRTAIDEPNYVPRGIRAGRELDHVLRAVNACEIERRFDRLGNGNNNERRNILAVATVDERMQLISALAQCTYSSTTADEFLEILDSTPEHLDADLAAVLYDNNLLRPMIEQMPPEQKDAISQFFITHIWKFSNATQVVEVMKDLELNQDFSAMMYALSTIRANNPDLAEDVAQALYNNQMFADLFPAILSNDHVFRSSVPEGLYIPGIKDAVSPDQYRQYLDDFLSALPEGPTKQQIMERIASRYGIDPNKRFIFENTFRQPLLQQELARARAEGASTEALSLIEASYLSSHAFLLYNMVMWPRSYRRTFVDFRVTRRYLPTGFVVLPYADWSLSGRWTQGRYVWEPWRLYRRDLVTGWYGTRYVAPSYSRYYGNGRYGNHYFYDAVRPGPRISFGLGARRGGIAIDLGRSSIVTGRVFNHRRFGTWGVPAPVVPPPPMHSPASRQAQHEIRRDADIRREQLNRQFPGQTLPRSPIERHLPPRVRDQLTEQQRRAHQQRRNGR